jgi:D-alanyl-D-alanine carboxypeptidase/D-alanyl-D-alanine-endopeptidase (penicillin-binding protein 4)
MNFSELNKIIRFPPSGNTYFKIQPTNILFQLSRTIAVLTLLQIFWGFTVAGETDWDGFRSKVQPLIHKGVLLIAKNGEPHFHYTTNPNRKWIPASTLKIPLALYALDIWGQEHHFTTEIYLRNNQDLLIRGLGDPFLVSEEIRVLGDQLKSNIPTKLRHLLLDNSAFKFPLQADGVQKSKNPYDALNGALLVNFNTVSLSKSPNGSVSTTEDQTPLTPIAISLGKKIKPGTKRVNLSENPALAQKYSGELMQAIWRNSGIQFSGEIKNAQMQPKDKLILIYRNTKSLKEILHAMLKYSSNFIANQILLSATLEKGQTAVYFETSVKLWMSWWQHKYGIHQEEIKLMEASGISRKNQLSEQNMLKVLVSMRSHQDLLSEYQGLKSKTGSLKGIYSLVGYAGSLNEWEFVLFLDQEKNTRDAIAKEIYNHFRHGTE